MATESITKPELGYLNTLLSLERNPAAPVNIKKDPTVWDRLTQADFRAAWQLTEETTVPGKAHPTLPSGDAGINKSRRYYKYEKPWCDETVEAEGTSLCDVSNTTVEPHAYLAVDIDQYASKSWITTMSDFDLLMESPSDRRADQIRRAAYAIKTAANAQVINSLHGFVSDYADGTDGLTATKHITLINETGDILPVSMAKIAKEYRDSLYKGDYVILGGSTIAQYFDVRMYRLSPEGRMGVTDSLSNLPMIYDSQFDTIWQGLQADTLSHGVVVPIGSVFVDTFNEFTGYKRLSDPNYVYTTINIDGTLFDYSMKFDECDLVWKEMLTLHYGIGSIPDAIYCDGNGLIRHYTFGCGPVDCDVLS